MDKAPKNSGILLGAIAIAINLIVTGSCGTTNSMHSGNRSPSVILHNGLLGDRDGNQYPIKVLLDSSLWMTVNLNLNIPNSYCYENTNENCAKYGRLYDWESAKQGCSLLGEGWRLPSDGDWLQLVRLYGGIAEDSKSRAYQALLSPGTSGFNAALGGNRDPNGNYARKEAHGFYWTATENDSTGVWYYNFGKGSLALYRQDGGEKARAFSVRCVNGNRINRR